MTSLVPFLGVVDGTAFPPTKSLQDVVPEVRPQFEALISYASSLGLKPKIRSAGRTCEEQAEQMKLGYSEAGLCRSMHTIGHAVDLDVTPGDCATYTKLGKWWEARGGVWGGRWTQFGPCGDSGHFHYGFNGAGAVPTSVCPAEVTLASCKQIRQDYLTQAFSRTGVSSGMGLLAGLAIVGAAGLILWGTLRVRPGRLVLAKENPADTKQPGKLVFRLADEQGSWSSENFSASTSRSLAKGIQRAWEEYIASHARSTTHPSFALAARQMEIRQWFAERVDREATAEQRKSWDAQVAHWEWQAKHELGGVGGKLGLQVRSNIYDIWLITSPGPQSAKPPRLVSEASAAKWLKWAAAWEKHDRELAGLAGYVGDVVEEETKKIEKARRRSKFVVVKA